MKKPSEQPVKLNGTVESLKKYLREGRHYATFKVANQQVTVETGHRSMAIENGDKVIAIGYIDDLGNMTPEIFANQSRDIFIQSYSLRGLLILSTVFTILTTIFFSIVLLFLFFSNPITKNLDMLVTPVCLGSIFLLLTIGSHKRRSKMKKLQALFESLPKINN